MHIKTRLQILLTAFFFLVNSAMAQEKMLNIVFIPKSNDQIFWEIMRAGVDEAVNEVGNINLTWRGPAYNDDVDAQIRILQAYTRPGIDAIVIAPTDRLRLVEPIKHTVDQGIKVIVVDSGVNSTAPQNFITTDNYASGQIAAKHLSDTLNKKGKIVVFRIVAGSASTDDRAQGFIDYINRYSPDMKIIADIYGGGSRGKARHNADELLRKLPVIDGIFAVNESSTDGVLRALRDAGRAQKTKLVGFDSSDFLFDGLAQRDVEALIVQDPRQMGYISIKAAASAILNDPIKEAIIFTPAKLVTYQNYLTPEIKKLISTH
jgi:ribose transport system substrate-binding protein